MFFAQDEADLGTVTGIKHVVVFVFNVPPTDEVIWRRGHGLRSHPTDL